MLHHLPPLVLLPHFLASVPPWVENIWNIWLKFDFWALPFHNWILWLELYSYIDYIWVYTKLWFFQRSPNRSWRNEKHRHSANDRLNWTRWRPFFLGKLNIIPCKIIFSAHFLSCSTITLDIHAIGAVLNSSVLSKLPCGFGEAWRRRPYSVQQCDQNKRARFSLPAAAWQGERAPAAKLSCPRGGGRAGPTFWDGWFTWRQSSKTQWASITQKTLHEITILMRCNYWHGSKIIIRKKGNHVST